MLNYIDPISFGNLASFLALYNQKSSEAITALRKVLKPYMLRRTKETVHKSIPPKEETLIEIPFTGIQKKYYRAIFEKNREYLERSNVSNANLINIVMV